MRTYSKARLVGLFVLVPTLAFAQAQVPPNPIQQQTYGVVPGVSLQSAPLNPALTVCGTSPVIAIGSGNNAGQVTTGTGTPSACTVTFATPYPNNAYCTVSPADGLAITYRITSQSKTAFTTTLSAGTNGAVFQYVCLGN